MRMRLWVFIFAMLSFFSSPLLAHEEHDMTSPALTTNSPTHDTLTSVNTTTESTSFWNALLSHPHNKVVHFPIALGVFAFLFFLLALRWSNLRISAELLVLFGFLASVVAVTLGELQKSAFIGTDQESLMRTHERFGWITAIGFFLWLILMRWRPTRRWAWLIGMGIALLVFITGFFGGQLAHTIGS